SVRVWDVTVDQEAIIIDGHPDGAAAVAFSPDNRRLALLGRHGDVKVCEAGSGAEINPELGKIVPRLNMYIRTEPRSATRSVRPLHLKPPLRAVGFSPEAERIVAIYATPGTNPKPTTWDASTEKRLEITDSFALD